jgi:uncharacterized integral membrane protein
VVPLSIKGGNLLHVGNDAVLLDRLQTAGPGTVNVKRTQVYELGNYKSVGQVSDIPDLSFTMESLDVSCAMEALLLDKSVETNHTFDLSKAHVLNVKSAFKPGQGMTDEFKTVGSAAVPCLTLESVSYKYGVGTTNASQTATLKGDSLYYNPGSTYIQKATGTASAGQTIVTTYPAYAVTEAGVTRRTLAITAGAQRLLFDIDYTEAYGAITDGAAVTTVTIAAAVPTTDTIYVTYASSTIEEFPQSVHALVSGVSGTLLSAATSTTSVLDLSTPVVAGDVVILDDVSGSAVTETIVAGVVTAPVTLGTVAVAITTGILTVSAPHTLAVGDPVKLGTMTGGAPLVAGTTYYVETSSTPDLTLAATPGGTAIATTTSGTSTSIIRQGWSAATVSPLVNSHLKGAPFAQYVPTVKPAAIRGRDIDIYIGPYVPGAATAAAARGTKRHGVQTASMDWKVTLQNDEELGNYHYVAIDFDVPVVSGSIDFKPQLVSEMLTLMRDMSGESDPLKSANPTDAPLLDVQVALKNPLDGRVLKRLWCPDARFSLPGYSGKVQTKLDFTAAFTSDMGLLTVQDS